MSVLKNFWKLTSKVSFVNNFQLATTKEQAQHPPSQHVQECVFVGAIRWQTASPPRGFEGIAFVFECSHKRRIASLRGEGSIGNYRRRADSPRQRAAPLSHRAQHNRLRVRSGSPIGLLAVPTARSRTRSGVDRGHRADLTEEQQGHGCNWKDCISTKRWYAMPVR